MTTDKARKRAVRDRMTRTGESYTAARRHVAPPDPGPLPLPPRVAEPEVSEAAILRGTGRGWDDWLRILDARGIEQFSHRATAAWLVAEHGVSSWWAQSITVGFERARGLRAAHQVGSTFSVGISKTVPAGVEAAWGVVAEETGRARWLSPGLLRERTASPGRNARFDLANGSSRVTVHVVSKGDARTTLTIQHERLASAAEVEEWRAFWKARLAALAEVLAPDADPAPAPRRGALRSAATAEPAAAATDPLAELLETIDPAKAAVVVELDRLVRAAAPDLDAAIKYRMLTYALERNWWRWVAAISVTKQAVNLRLLYGTRLESGVGILRPGSSHLANLDLDPDAPVDAELVTRLVREAVARHPEFVAAE